MFDLASHSHRRFNPLTRTWVLVAPHRADRPWQGERAPEAGPAPPGYDPGCYLCPGNIRARGQRNPAYRSTFVFDNDFPALGAAPAQAVSSASDALFDARVETGICRVVCFSPRHDLTLARLSASGMAQVVDVWAEQYDELSRRDGIAAVTIFENRGAMAGASNPHPHGQIWANSLVPGLLATECEAMADYRQAHGRCLLCDYLRRELAAGERVVCENESFVALVPFWAYWPFELMLLSKEHVSGFNGLDSGARAQLAGLLQRVNVRYDHVFESPFPVSWGWHLPPCGGAGGACHLHAHFFPPLLRSATVRKFTAAYELLAMPQRDLSPERAAAQLRALSDLPAPEPTP